MNRLCCVIALWLAMLPALHGAEIEATVHWLRKVVLSTPVSGVVVEVHGVAGARVNKGQALVTLDPRRFEARLDEARAKLSRAAPTLEEARRELARIQDLYDRTVASEHELALATIGVTRALADEQVARAEVVRAELALERSVLRAPFDGVVVSRSAEIGQSVVTRLQSVPLITLGDSQRLVARAALPAVLLSRLEIGDAVTVDLPRGASVTGAIYALGLEPLSHDGGEPRYGVHVAFRPPPEGALRIGQPVRLILDQ